MLKKSSMKLLLFQPRKKPSTTKDIRLPENTKSTKFWPWLGSILIVGLIILTVADTAAWNWLKSLPFSSSTTSARPSITTLNVQRSATYADLNFTLVNAQYATNFPDDPIHPGQATVRLNLQVTNKTPDQIAVIYYDIARLLAPKLQPIAPTNVHLSAQFKAGTSDTGWLDFPIAAGIQLSTLKLQLGSAHNGETLLTIPCSGPFDPSRYANKISHQAITTSYNFEQNILLFHLTSVDVRYGYRGTQVRAGQQFYVLSFLVDNPNAKDVSPGSGFDYVRLVLNGENRPPIDATLPITFKAGAKGIGGHVAFVAPAGMRMITIGFLFQAVPGQQNQDVSL